MPSLHQIATYARLFRLLRGRKPSVSETLRYFGAAPRLSAAQHQLPSHRGSDRSREWTPPAALNIRNELIEF
jgi:hypothetical protein